MLQLQDQPTSSLQLTHHKVQTLMHCKHLLPKLFAVRGMETTLNNNNHISIFSILAMLHKKKLPNGFQCKETSYWEYIKSTIAIIMFWHDNVLASWLKESQVHTNFNSNTEKQCFSNGLQNYLNEHLYILISLYFSCNFLLHWLS